MNAKLRTGEGRLVIPNVPLVDAAVHIKDAPFNDHVYDMDLEE